MYGRDFSDLDDSPEWPTDEQLQDWNEANDYVNEGEDFEDDEELEDLEDDDDYEEDYYTDSLEDQYLDSSWEDQYEPQEY